MDDFLRSFIYKRFRLGGITVSVLDVLLGICITGVGVMLRMSVMEYTPVTSFKLLSMGLDFIMALLGAAFIRERTKSHLRAVMTYGLMVIWPVFAANSALWGKNSVFCGILLILALYAYDKQMKKVSLGAVAVCVFLWKLGMPARTSEDLLTLGWPNIFELTGKFMFVDLYETVAWLFILGILVCIVYCVRKKQIRMSRELILPLLLFFAIFLPYFAPFMPAWAGYGADVLALLLAILVPKKFYIAILHLIVSYSSYAFVLNGESKLPMSLYSVILFVLLLDVGAYVYGLMNE